MSCEEHFFKQLRERGLRLTPQREMVLSVLHGIDGLATADEIYERVKTISSSVDLSTVYRNLELLQEFHLVSSAGAADGQRRYELVGIHGAHAHLVCRECGEISSVGWEELQPFLAFLRDERGFSVDVEHLSIPGLCRKCAAAESASRRR